VDFASALDERAHVTGYRRWRAAEGNDPAPAVLCIDTSATHDHNFSSDADDYLTFYFTSASESLTCDNVFPQIGEFGSRPIHVARSGGGWQATCKLPPGLTSGWHHAMLRTSRSEFSAPLRIGIDAPRWDACVDPELRLTRVADGKSFESARIRVGDDSAISVWVAGLPEQVRMAEVRIRLNGTDLPAIWLAPADGDAPRQVNALLPAGMEPGDAQVSLVYGERESAAVEIELHN
jgi:hypothetical protein